jgi:hypothetical protein
MEGAASLRRRQRTSPTAFPAPIRAAHAPSVLASTDEQCAVHDGGNGVIEVATFPNMGNEVKWIQADLAYGCCIEGHLWAANYSSEPGYGDFGRIMKALGGRQVNGG